MPNKYSYLKVFSKVIIKIKILKDLDYNSIIRNDLSQFICINYTSCYTCIQNVILYTY